ncbi:hypothetical protein BJ138DRAFT_1156107 [Hygrophoropsis aurantiaca]|uniref:Uncharacterized protein n=1 Tax=Hygrophoropsis aurantiaca TaxID=72124 RepID=A0ACB8A6Z8_9AGAM|nr:hypothetical protein BJ138DRAFT_1156107 [Hygrophoropsis aurantiaca]
MLKFIRLRLQQADVPLQIVSTGKIGANWLRNIVFRQPIFRFANVYNGEQDQGGGFSILPIAGVESRSNTTALSSDVIPSAPLLESRVPASTVASPSVPWNNHVPSFMRIREPIKENGKISANRNFIKEARRARREGATKHKTGILPGDKDKDKVRISKSRRAIPYTSVSTRHQRDKSIRGVCVSDAKPWLGDQIKAMFSKWSKELSDKNTVGQGVVPKKGPDDQQVEDELSDYEDDKSSDQAHRDEIVKPRRNEGPEKYSCSIHYSNHVCDDLLQGFRMLMTSAA